MTNGYYRYKKAFAELPPKFVPLAPDSRRYLSIFDLSPLASRENLAEKKVTAEYSGDAQYREAQSPVSPR
jgi:hypothetical protein